MAIKYKVMAATGKYTTNDGQEKNRWMQVGTVFEKDGRFSMKIDAIPVGPEFNGWLSFFEPDVQENKPRRPPARKSSDPFDGMDDDIPF